MDITNSIAILTKKIESLEALICANSKKELMTLEDVVAYTGYRRSSLLTLVCHREIPVYKPRGGKLVFKRSEIDEWMFRNRQRTNEELRAEAHTYCLTHR